MFRFAKLASILCVLSVLCSCSFNGETDFAVFEERFNDKSENIKIDDSNFTSERQNDNTKYCCYFDAEKGGKYLISVYERNDVKVVSACTLCVLSSIKLDLGTIEDLFCSMLYAYNQTNKKESLEIFKKLGLDNKEKYATIGTKTEKLGKSKIDVVVNGAGTAITIS
ncbi:MAG: hypothetical protein RSE39_07555 [Oscillospiraceae bacterium]